MENPRIEFLSGIDNCLESSLSVGKLFLSGSLESFDSGKDSSSSGVDIALFSGVDFSYKSFTCFNSGGKSCDRFLGVKFGINFACFGDSLCESGSTAN